ncbi:MAG: penicillin-binding protein 2 [Bacillota bacterium]
MRRYRRRDDTAGGQHLTRAELKSRRDLSVVLIGLIFITLTGQLVNLQVVRGDYYRRLSTENHVRITPIQAPRGDIVARGGELLVTSRTSFSVYYWYLDQEKADATLPRLCQILGIDESEMEAKVKKYSGRYFEPIPIARDIDPETHTAIVEDAPNLPGVFIEPEPIRFYPEGELASTVLGYVSEITAEQLEDPVWDGYSMGDTIGQQGLEAFYEGYLRGKDGGYQVEVNNVGRPTGNVGPGIEPESGYDVHLNLDVGLQRAAEEALRKAIEESDSAKTGAAVVLDVKTGAVLAMASCPGFDANRLVTGISQQDLNEYVNTGKWRFSNLATTGLYPPGSTFKIVTAVAALAEGKVTATETFYDPGYHPNVPSLPCHRAGGHGYVDMVDALAVSCNVYFYEMGRRLGVDALAKYAEALGLGSKTGIDLPSEYYGTVPSTKWKAAAYAEGRVAQPEVLYSEHMMAAMGQVFHLDTPIQMASVTQAIANDGVRMRPRLASHITDSAGNVVAEFPPEVISTLDVDKSVFDTVKQGMMEVTSHSKGTAYWAFWDLPFRIAGKTGTAENPLGKSHAWFVGFGPYEDPEIAVAVVVDQGGSGSAVAAPVARMIFDAYGVEQR